MADSWCQSSRDGAVSLAQGEAHQALVPVSARSVKNRLEKWFETDAAMEGRCELRGCPGAVRPGVDFYQCPIGSRLTKGMVDK